MHPQFFISANTGNGFYSLYDGIFQNDTFNKIYVIHGGPGTGKSTLMRRIARAAAAAGAQCEEILCSSDPSSLDGLILSQNGRRVGILDGTSPHPRIISVPSAKEELWNLGAFWDSARTEAAYDRIAEENLKKKSAYKRAYSLLHAALSCHEEIKRETARFFDVEKAKAQVRRAVHKLSLHGGGERKLFRAYSMQGEAISTRAYDMAKKQILLCGKKHTAELYLSYFANALAEKQIAHTVFLSPLSEKYIDAIYIAESETVLLHEGLALKDRAYRRMNTSRFLKKEKESPFIRRIARLEEALIAEALTALAEAGKSHFALEEIYKGAMRFDELQRASGVWITDVLSHLG